MTGWAAAAATYHVASRLVYVVGIGVALSREWHYRVFTRSRGVEAGFSRFRRLAAWVLANDAVSFVLLCLLTRGTLRPELPRAAVVSAGVLLVVAGIGIKRWAAQSLDAGAYYWRDFFAPEEIRLPDPPGPYRYFKHPMYTVGYLHAYGFALICGSPIGLAAALFDQLAVLLFARLVERPHLEQILASRQGGQGPSSFRSR